MHLLIVLLRCQTELIDNSLLENLHVEVAVIRVTNLISKVRVHHASFEPHGHVLVDHSRLILLIVSFVLCCHEYLQESILIEVLVLLHIFR